MLNQHIQKTEAYLKIDLQQVRSHFFNLNDTFVVVVVLTALTTENFLVSCRVFQSVSTVRYS